MTVGVQPSNGTIDSILTNLSVGIRDMMALATNLSTEINGQGNGTAVLANIGYSTVPSATNPGGVSDAALALEYIAYFTNVAGVYYGNIPSGAGTAVSFNYNQALSPLWGGR